eukprot:TRINITY_DN4901_c0_g1_i1.p1 TRINITY_DN4901_c0_g1~~TRINITY_DN4901_c0_g1_i1.p1  ORF type:complete len:139 (-),score=38.21 TRINITY_DN4901_c0_g1_i1:33-449(-)
MGKKQKGGGSQPEFMVRMNYLHQSAHALNKYLSSSSSSHSKKELLRRIGSNLSHLMVGIGLKSVSRCHPSLKRTICKGCHSVLTPGVSSELKISKAHVLISCSFCKDTKSYPLARKGRKSAGDSEKDNKEVEKSAEEK